MKILSLIVLQSKKASGFLRARVTTRIRISFWERGLENLTYLRTSKSKFLNLTESCNTNSVFKVLIRL